MRILATIVGVILQIPFRHMNHVNDGIVMKGYLAVTGTDQSGAVRKCDYAHQCMRTDVSTQCSKFPLLHRRTRNMRFAAPTANTSMHTTESACKHLVYQFSSPKQLSTRSI